ncbi:MAG: IS1380 family transposase [Bryobacteraceae bacterium]
MADSRGNGKWKINRVEPTSECLTGRAGLSLFVRYLASTQMGKFLGCWFAGLRKSRKGLGVLELFKQVLCFFADGTSRHLTHFDELAKDAGYAATIETPESKMASSHQVKRFFGSFSFVLYFLFRRVLGALTVWRLRVRQPDVVVLDVDTMVMDNDEAEVREGVGPTYKKVKGFQPLQMTWGRYIVDAVFRGGSKHGNSGSIVVEMVRRMVKLIRKKYRANVPIVLTCDAGFFDQENFAAFEALGIGFICGGKLYKDIQAFVAKCPKGDWTVYRSETAKEREWEVLAFGDRRGSWTRFRRALYCRPLTDNGQGLLQFARPETVLYTNLGMGFAIDEALRTAGLEAWLSDAGVLERYHGRGANELAHRGLKDFGSETLPFKRFESNAAFYYTMVMAFNLFESFKEDVVSDVIPVASYATTVRRKLFDIAGKIVRKGRSTILRIAEAAWARLGFAALWHRANQAPVVALE